MSNDDTFQIDPSLIERENSPVDMAMAPRKRPSIVPPPVKANLRDVAVGAASIKAARRDGSHRPTFPLERTGGVARVKRPSMLALGNSAALPDHLRPLIEAIAVRAIREPSEAVKAQMDQFNVQDAIELVDVTCIEGFLDPTLVPNDSIKSPEGKVYNWPGSAKFDKLEDQGYVRCDPDGNPYGDSVMYLDEIDLDDRAEFFAWCNESTRREAAAVAPFPADINNPVPLA
jgi:hypothetical protein